MNIETPEFPTNLKLGDRYGAKPVDAPPMEPLDPPKYWRRFLFSAAKTFIWFTVLPVNRIMNNIIGPEHNPDYEIRLDQYYWLPLVGACVVSVSIAVMLLATWLGIPSILACLLAGFTYHALYGHIHLEGLSDTIDALRAYPRKEPLQVLTEPYTGALGARYSGTANNLTAILMAAVLHLYLETGNLFVLVSLVAVVVNARNVPLMSLMGGMVERMPGGAEALGVPSISFEHKTKMLIVSIAAITIPLITIAVSNLFLSRPSVAVGLTLIVSVVTISVGRYYLNKAVNYLNLLYGDLFGAAIIAAEIAGLSALLAMAHLFKGVL